MPTDFRYGKTFPPRARERYHGFDYLLRAFDNGRASRNETIFDYVYPCPIEAAVLA
jgi:hypothetical protein